MALEVSNYEEDVEIDESILDVMWIDQPRLTAKYCRIMAHYQRTMDLAEERVNFVKSTLARDIRADPSAHDVVPGSRGITEDQIKAATRVNEEYRAANRAYIEAKYQFEVARGAVKSVDNRKAALENLVRLHGQQYFAGPSVPHDLSVERQRHDADRQAQRVVKAPRLRSEDDAPRPRFQRRS